MKIVPKLDDIRLFGILAFWNGLEYHNFLFQQVNRQSFLYSLWKFGEIRNSDPVVLGERICTAGVDNCYHA